MKHNYAMNQIIYKHRNKITHTTMFFNIKRQNRADAQVYILYNYITNNNSPHYGLFVPLVLSWQDLQVQNDI